jgi:hypothetical protein
MPHPGTNERVAALSVEELGCRDVQRMSSTPVAVSGITKVEVPAV